MNLRQIFHAAVDLGEAADKFCRRYPDHRTAMVLRDLGQPS